MHFKQLVQVRQLMPKPGLRTLSSGFLPSLLCCHFNAASSNLCVCGGGVRVGGRGTAQRWETPKMSLDLRAISTSGIENFNSTFQYHLNCQFSWYFLVHATLSSQNYYFWFPADSRAFLCKLCQLNDLASPTEVSHLFNWQLTKLTSAKTSLN